MPTRRDLYRTGTMVLGFAMTMLLAVPGVAFVLDPLRRKLGAVKSYPLARLDELVVGVPRAFPIVDERQDAWVRYPKEPVGLVWLIRQADPKEPVIAFTAECPHLGCAVNLSADRKFFRCPCHDSAFRFDGTPENKIPPRGMDRLEVEPLKSPESLIQVKFQRFRSQTEEKIPLLKLEHLSSWFDERTGYKALVHEALEEPIPGGARWKYVFGSALTGTFFVQVITGVLLMSAYSPSSSTAWGSVFYISHVMNLGWFLRGLHHFGSQAMVILLVLHLLQVVLAGAYRAPREVNWWFGMLLMGLTLGFSLTGYLLPWDQKGFWATKVATKIASGTPVIGPSLESVVVGGSDYGNHTLTRFYGLHVGVFPALMVLFLVAHVALFRKHGVTAPRNAQGVEKFWPKQVFYDTAACAIVLAIMAFVVWREHGAPLDAPADPSSLEYPARPEWYFLSLFQMLKKFPGKYEFVGTMVVPGAIATVLFLLPLLDKLLPRGLAHFLACAFVFSLVGGAGYLTYEAFQADEHDPRFQESRRHANQAAARALELAEDPRSGIPPSGAGDLLKLDPQTRGLALLEQKCLGCHSYGGVSQAAKDAPFKGAELKGFGSRGWIVGLLNNPTSEAHLLRAPKKPGDKTGETLTGMQEWKKGSTLEPAELRQVADFVASFAKVPEDASFEDWSSDPQTKMHPGYENFVEECLACHTLGNLGAENKTRAAPGLFAYGSRRWTKRMIKKPGSKERYGFLPAHRQMPGFEDQLTANDLEMIVRCLELDYLGGNPGGGTTPANTRD